MAADDLSDVNGNEEQDTITIRKPGRTARIIAATLVSLTLGVALAIGGFFIGQGTRMSDAEVHAQRVSAVKTAVTRAVARKGAEDHAARLRIMARHEERMKRHSRRVIRRVVRKLHRSSDRRAQQSFASGSQSGYTNGRQDGYDDGVETGLVKGSDQLTCSDDPDVYWLPAC